jgi:hypothetical protein
MSQSHDIKQLSAAENIILTADFNEKEVHGVVIEMKNNKAPGLDISPLNSI